ncbi:MAG: outer membrane beta-barrel protein [Sulfuriferula sp.]
MKKTVFALLALSAFVATPALADNTGKFYVAGDLGSASYSNVTVGAGTYPNPGVISIAGGYHFSPMLAAEVGYSMFGDSVLTNGFVTGTVSASSLKIAAVGTYALNPQFDLIGKLGLANNSQKIVATAGGASASVSGSQSDLLVGVGAQYNLSSQTSLRVQYENFGKFGNFGTTGQKMSASAISLGVAYTF